MGCSTIWSAGSLPAFAEKHCLRLQGRRESRAVYLVFHFDSEYRGVMFSQNSDHHEMENIASCPRGSNGSVSSATVPLRKRSKLVVKPCI
jgi:hypothetical protein